MKQLCLIISLLSASYIFAQTGELKIYCDRCIPDNRASATAYTDSEPVGEDTSSTKKARNESFIFEEIEQDPIFPGGQRALLKYISDHLCYPIEAKEKGIQGKVVVQFVISSTGSIGEVKVVRSKDPELDKEAVRIVKSFPKFIPGKWNGEPVEVLYTLPITFKLPEDEATEIDFSEKPTKINELQNTTDHKIYSGEYRFDGMPAFASYSFMEDSTGAKILDGDFFMKINQPIFSYNDCWISGKFVNNKQSGIWTLESPYEKTTVTLDNGIFDGPISIIYHDYDHDYVSFIYTFAKNGLLNGPFSFINSYVRFNANFKDGYLDGPFEFSDPSYMNNKTISGTFKNSRLEDNDELYKYVQERFFKYCIFVDMDDVLKISGVNRLAMQDTKDLSFKRNAGTINFSRIKIPQPIHDKNQIYECPSIEPQFPGGQVALLKYVQEHIHYPKSAKKRNIQGRVSIQFVVTSSGKIGEVRVVRSVDPDLDKEAIRVIKTLPQFIPGKIDEQHPVDSWYFLPITFKLPEDKNSPQRKSQKMSESGAESDNEENEVHEIGEVEEKATFPEGNAALLKHIATNLHIPGSLTYRN